MSQNDSNSPREEDHGEPLPSDQEMLEALQSGERKSRLIWTVVFVVGSASIVASILLAAEYRELLFRPTPDMKEVEEASFARSNDPACRQLLEVVDGHQKQWVKDRVVLKELDASSDLEALKAGRKTVLGYIESYELERRRLEIAVIQDRDHEDVAGEWTRTDIRTDMRRYFKHVLYYLRKMDALLEARIAEVSGGEGKEEGARVLDVPGLGKVDAAAAAKPSPPGVSWARAWSQVTEDHDKWRIFRQGPTPCGRRDGAVPELPPPSSGNALDDLKREYGAVGFGGIQDKAKDAGATNGAEGATNGADAPAEGATNGATDGGAAPATNGATNGGAAPAAGGATNGGAAPATNGGEAAP